MSVDKVISYIQDYGLTFLLYFIIVNILALLASLVIIIFLPADFLVRDYSPKIHPILATLRNCLGIALMVMGAVMLLTPGPGVLTIFCGVICLHSRVKQKMLRYLCRKEATREQIKKIRVRFKRPVVIFPHESERFD